MAATIEFKKNGDGMLEYGPYKIKVKGKPGFKYSKDVNLSPSGCYESTWSDEFNTNMKWAVGPIQWEKGAYIHQGSTSSASTGCVIIDKGKAKNFHDYVNERSSTHLLISYPW